MTMATGLKRLLARTRVLSTGMVLVLALPAGPARAAEVFGLMPVRDLTPMGFVRLDMHPASAVAMQDDWAIETGFAAQNTWALSPNVEQYLKSLEPSGRRRLGPAELEAIRALPGESYLVDIESTVVDLTVHHRLSRDWSAYLSASGVSYGTGHLDGAIENFHRAFGFGSFGRPAVARNQANMIFDLKAGQHASFDAPSGGITDPTIGLRYAAPNPAERWGLSVEAAVKLPVDGRREMLSSGRVDYGVQAALRRRGLHHALYVAVSTVYFAGDTFPVHQEARLIPTVVVGYERAVAARTSIILQGYASSSVYSRQETNLDELLAKKYQATLGLRHRREEFLWSFGLTENIENLNNTPDVGFQLGLTYFPGRH